MADQKKRSYTQRVLNVWGIILIVWSIYRAYFRTDLPIWVDEFIAKPIVFILPVYYFITHIEGENFFKGLDLQFTNITRNSLIGITVGLVFLVSGALGVFVKTKTFSFLHISPTILFAYVAISLATSITEEIVSRGFVLKRMYRESGNIVSACFFTSILFFFLHIPILLTNDRIVGFVLLKVLFTDLVLSLAVSYLYLQRKSLFVPILIHTFYTLSLYLFT